ncbi:hypothetical protein [Acetobacter fallax]|uniref:Lipoprotein n=1 Tax=Acetobacter fallax TaxID=1737473 RepID=A0ABX0KAD7_9PROT|nr:hypothetical protein [Acetobacter fallax]NHO33364.1 hypothetical protein [Acetobacter fallax]NHO36984.1 hypothetical protein [Acetobacter fallax]
MIVTLCLLSVSCASHAPENAGQTPGLADAAWARKPGYTTVLLHGMERTDRFPEGKNCNVADHALMFPDTEYFRNWYRTHMSGHRIVAEMSKDAKTYLRLATREEGCLYRFTNLPAGNWGILINLSWYESGMMTSGRALVQSDEVPTGTGLTYGEMRIGPDQILIRRNFVLDEKQVPTNHHPFRPTIPQGLLEPWTDPKHEDPKPPVQHPYGVF